MMQRITLWGDLRALWQARYLYRLWLSYRIQVRYAQTWLGIVWIALLPLATSLTLAFALGVVLGLAPQEGIPYVPFLMCGQVLFNFFSNTLLQSRDGIYRILHTAQQAYFPRSLAILLVVGETLVDFAFTLVALLLIIAISGLPFTWAMGYAILPLAILVLFTTGLAFFVGWLSFSVRDFQQLLTVLLNLLLFLLPVLYPAERVPPPYDLLMHLNPLAALIEALRASLLHGRAPEPLSLLYAAACALLVLYYGYRFFRAHEDAFVDLL